jgi:leucyl/phenylalanyl-tRNA--protein transferase
MIEAYCKLNELGIAKSIEVWQNEELVGGLYGIDLGRIFVGKVCFLKFRMRPRAFISLVKQLQEDNYKLLDCQVYNPHLESLGCREIDRVQFMDLIRNKD